MMPCEVLEAGRLAGWRRPSRLTLLRMCSGFQPISAALRIACAANFGIATLKNTSAPDAFSSTICESMVGSVVS